MNTSAPPIDDDLRRRASRRVAQRLSFYTHAGVFVLVNLGLAAINTVQGGARWHLWPLGWWGLGLAIHGLVTLVSLRGEGLRDRLVDEEVERLRQRR